LVVALESKAKLFGRSVPRLEDRALITGAGRYLDDIQPKDCAIAAFVRSPYAHAKFTTIDKEAALQMPGVIAVMTMDDLRPYLSSDYLVVGLPSKAIKLLADRPILSLDEPAYVGEPVAMVIAQSRHEAEDAAEAIEIDFDPLPAVADCRAALDADAPTAHTRFDHNLLAEFDFAFGDVDAAFRRAAHHIEGSYHIHRGGSHSMEGRGVLAINDELNGILQVWSSTQTPMALKKSLAALLEREDNTVRVFTPDVGGGFGPKLVTYPEEIAVAVAAIALKRPVKWVEDRREHFLSATQERDQFWNVEMALDAEGMVLGIRADLIHDHGAYTARGVNVPYNSAATLPLAYNVPAYYAKVSVALTNRVPVTPIRGAGQPQGTFVMERMLDKAARKVGIDRLEIRRRNLVRGDQMPCVKPLKLRGGTNIILDSGDYPATMAAAADKADWNAFEQRRAEALKRGRLLGIGVANYVEGTGRGPYERVTVRVSTTGKIMVTTSAAAMGQGVLTMLSQVVGEQLGPDRRHDRVCRFRRLQQPPDGDGRRLGACRGNRRSQEAVTSGLASPGGA
jgi:aerobic carbon-monoxide dehydrogenase large subunit